MIHRVAAFCTVKDGKLIGGNPAGVSIVQSFGTVDEMRSIAANLGYSETAFVCPVYDQKNGINNTYRVRYFSPESEVPFCGHATIALGSVLANTIEANDITEQSFTLLLNHATIRILVKRAGSDTLVCEDNMPSYEVTLTSPPTSHRPVSMSDENNLLADLLPLFGLTSSDLRGLADCRDKHNNTYLSKLDLSRSDITPALINAGAQHLLLPLINRSSLEAMEYDFDAVKQLMIKHGLVTVMLVHQSNHTEWVVRNAFASGGVVEDPATGAAAAAFVGYLRDVRYVDTDSDTDTDTVTLYQGAQIEMPSVITARYQHEAGLPIKITGRTRYITCHSNG